MGGYMVQTESGDHRNFYMVNAGDPEQACADVNRAIGLSNAQALAPITDDTLAQFNVQPGQPWLCTTTRRDTGEVTHSELALRG
jgi:hypothetical protein